MVTGLSHDDHKRITAALAEAGKRTSARFELVTVPLSDRYALYPIIYGAVAGLAVFGVIALFWSEVSLRTGFYATALAFVVVSLLLEWRPLRLMIVPKRVKHSHAAAMAHHAFAATILAQSERKPGAALLVSLGERYVQVIADREVHSRVPQETWDAVVADFADAARKGRITDGLLGAVESCTKVLEQHYPAK